MANYEPYFLLSPANELNFMPENAFTRDIAKEIGRKYNWTCQKTGKTFMQGYLIDIAHYDHDRSKPYYNTVRNGRPLYRIPHLEEHIQWYLADPSEKTIQHVRLCGQRCWGWITSSGYIKEGLRTYPLYIANPDLLYETRRETIAVFDKYLLDPSDFIIMDNECHIKYPPMATMYTPDFEFL